MAKVKEDLAYKIKNIVESNNAGFAFPSQQFITKTSNQNDSLE